MLTVCCIKFGEYYTAEYVNILCAGVQKHLKASHEFVCFTDDPTGINSSVDCRARPDFGTWWNKYWCFRVHGGPVLYLDLDVCVTGPLDRIATYCPGIVEDWLVTDQYNGSVISWEDGQLKPLLYSYNEGIKDRYRGFQYWMSEEPLRGALGMRTYPAGWCVSYREHAIEEPPATCSVVCFHGQPKPHHVTEGWVADAWRI